MSSFLTDILARRYPRRSVLKGGVALAVSAWTVGCAMTAGTALPLRRSRLGFKPVPHSTADRVIVPEGYRVQVLIPEGEPILPGAAPYRAGDLNSGAEREGQVGAHHDGMWFFPLASGHRDENNRGLLSVNHENADMEFLHPGGKRFRTENLRAMADEVRKEVASHGVSIVEIEALGQGRWGVVRGRYNRRITAATPMEIAGPVRGADLVRTRFSPDGTRARGTLNNCSSGHTPWNTYLTCEENWPEYFFNAAQQPREQRRYGVPATGARGFGWGTRPEEEYVRFDATPSAGSAAEDYRNEPNTFGWVVEIDPFDPASTPRKRTALGRLRHEGATVAPAEAGRPIVVYMGDDTRGECLYKFVSAEPYRPGETRGEILDRGTLFVARFDADGTGRWVALKAGMNGLTPEQGFGSEAEVLVNTRSAADQVGATRLDRPEWVAIDAESGFVYLTLTHNVSRGVDGEPVDAVNPRAANRDGHIVRWREAGGRYEAETFVWEIFAFGGPTRDTLKRLGEDAAYRGEQYAAQVFPGTGRRRFLDEGASFNSPDGLWVGPNGILWIQTDGYADPARGFGNQQMLAADPETGEIRRFLTGPKGCELTGITATPDGRTLFVNIQHPGAGSTWPNIDGETRPRSATLVITREDGGVIGS